MVYRVQQFFVEFDPGGFGFSQCTAHHYPVKRGNLCDSVAACNSSWQYVQYADRGINEFTPQLVQEMVEVVQDLEDLFIFRGPSLLQVVCSDY